MSNKVMREHMEERFGKVFNYSLTPPLPASLNIELNNTCNLKCVFCGYHGEKSPCPLRPAVMEFDFAKKILDEAKKLGIGKKEVGFYIAGEPLLYKRLPEVIAYAKSLGFQYTFLTTNGTAATAKRMEEVADSGLDSIRVSVNAGDKETYQEIHGADYFDRVLENIRHLNDYREKNHLSIAISISCVVTKKTRDAQQKIKDIFSPYVDDILFIPVMLDWVEKPEEWTEYELMDDADRNELTQINSDYICPILFDTMYIRSDGKIMPCCKGYDCDCVFADLHENFDLKASWHNAFYERYRKIFVEGASDEGTLCRACILRKKGAERFVMNKDECFVD